jgi:hypothetical protein
MKLINTKTEGNLIWLRHESHNNRIGVGEKKEEESTIFFN